MKKLILLSVMSSLFSLSAFAQSIQSIFLYGAPLALVCFVLAWLLPELALHSGRRQPARDSEAAVADEPQAAVLATAD